MSAGFHWTNRAQVVFTALASGKALALRDILNVLEIAGKSAQSSVVRAIAGWTRAGLLVIDRNAPANFPRYSLTPRGQQMWEDAAKSARDKAKAFKIRQERPPPRLPAPSAKGTQQGEDMISAKFKCPNCGRWEDQERLQQEFVDAGEVWCEGCGHKLDRYAKKFV